ncbi:signal transduction protein with CBS domain protein [mine drainage metagenome]|uniref:Signal transduction protein with CBS domain protein n=2 Tax=mine drainage metagenome TaxID=410659 RepID=T0YJ47_9ZZZZ
MKDYLIEESQSGLPQELITKVEYVDMKAPIQKAFSMLKKYPALLVKKNGTYYGVVDSRSIYSAKGGFGFSKNQSIDKYIAKAPAIDDSMRIDDVITAFYTSRAKALPYLLKNKVIGVIDRNTLVKIVLSLELLNNQSVSDAMSTPVIAVSDQISLSQAKSVMENNRIRRLIALKDNKFSGMVTYFSLLSNYHTINERLPEKKTDAYMPSSIRIADIMEKNPITVKDGAGLADAARLLAENNISSLVVVNRQGMPVGMLTVTDVLENVINRRRLEENKVFISGIDKTIKEYEPEIKAGLKRLSQQLEKVKSISIQYITMNIKRTRGNRYDIKVRVALKNGGIISVNVTDFILERTFDEALDSIKRDVMKEKERKQGLRKLNVKDGIGEQ